MQYKKRLRQKLTDCGILSGTYIVSKEEAGSVDIYLDGAYWGSYHWEKDEFYTRMSDAGETYLYTDVEAYVGKEDRLTVSMSLPATEGEIQDAAARARVNDSGEIPVTELNYNDIAYFFDADKGCTAQECSILANRLYELSAADRIRFEAGRRILEENSTELVESLINLSFELDQVVTLNVSNDTDLGKICVQNGLFPDISEQFIPYLNYALIGKERREKSHGIYYKEQYYEYTAQQKVFQKELYASAERPNFKLYLSKEQPDQRHIHEKYGVCASICLPYTREQYDAALSSLGLNSVVDCPYCVLKSGFKVLDNQIGKIENLKELGKINELAEAIAALRKSDALAKYKAILEYENAKDIDGMLEVYGRIEQFVFDEMTYHANEWGREKLRERLPQIPEEDEIHQFIDYDAYGKYLMQKEGFAHTAYGSVAVKNEQTQTIEQGG